MISISQLSHYRLGSAQIVGSMYHDDLITEDFCLALTEKVGGWTERTPIEKLINHEESQDSNAERLIAKKTR